MSLQPEAVFEIKQIIAKPSDKGFCSIYVYDSKVDKYLENVDK